MFTLGDTLVRCKLIISKVDESLKPYSRKLQNPLKLCNSVSVLVSSQIPCNQHVFKKKEKIPPPNILVGIGNSASLNNTRTKQSTTDFCWTA